MSRNLIIIGNGFDIDHNIESRYRDFGDYLKINDFDLYDKLSSIYNAKDLWMDFEKALGNPNLEVCKQLSPLFNGNVLPDIWDRIQLWLIKWVGKLNNDPIEAKYLLDKNDYYFSFNYTNTLTRCYKIDETHIKHIHGIGERAQVNSMFPNNYKEVLVIGHKHCNAESYVRDMVKNTEKDTEAIINNNQLYFNGLDKLDISTIKVMGMSYSDIDIAYFAKIKERLVGARWKFGYQNDADKLRLYRYIAILGIDEYEVAFNKNVLY